MSTVVFRRYLISLRDRYEMLLQVADMSGNHQEIEANQFHLAVDLLDDIIHHYDIIVNDELTTETSE